ncbi:MAPEG family protein [Paucibacter sp. DJ2R-2]|uniref:MAPEG family protein n=1 Tax=Paucibacter sp. DJ2R-2 TaxID=2893558 RepID=UPI0021E46F83|nr:MAPEG family protein [Paucibacter sp. DJ2R-2]MCV2421256.1 MAPEG family protein [Paucibacter sp. DJ4R-1]MCV2439234.1 MAPEG family protein [Paucibacter sp. DJ2R-2]
MPIVPLFAAILALLFFALSVRTLRLRHRLKIGLGDAGNSEMLRAVRVHSNFAEYVPITLLLLFFAENLGAPTWAMLGLGFLLVLGRCSHAYGVSQARENFSFRIAGMAMTFSVLLAATAYVFWVYGRSLLG